MGRPSVYPTGVTIYNKECAENGYTLFPSEYGATMIDMNGRVVKVWKGFQGNPLKALPGGCILGSDGHVPGTPGANSSVRALVVNWDGEILWEFKNNAKVTFPDGSEMMASKHHHDYEFEHLPMYYEKYVGTIIPT